MTTQTNVHPRLHHYGLITADLDAMIDWYQKVLGMTINHRSKIPAIARLIGNPPPFSAFAFISNDEMDHRIVFFEISKASLDPDKARHTGLQHLAFASATMDDLLSTYVRLKDLGIQPFWAADHGVGISFYYQDPDKNVVEIQVSNYDTPEKATEYLRSARGGRPAMIDPDKLVSAHKAGATPWTLHERATAGEFAPAKPYDPATSF